MSDQETELAERAAGRIAGALKSTDRNDALTEDVHEEMGEKLARIWASDMENRLSADALEGLVGGDEE